MGREAFLCLQEYTPEAGTAQAGTFYHGIIPDIVHPSYGQFYIAWCSGFDAKTQRRKARLIIKAKK
jgi:hypothetical protein